MVQRAPLLPLALALMGGIACQHWLPSLPTVAWWWSLAATAAAFGVTLIIRQRLDSYLPLVALMLCVFAVGGTLGRRHDPLYNNLDWSHCVGEQERPEYIALRLVSTPMPREKSYMAKAEVLSVGNMAAEGTTRVYFKKEPASGRLRYGDCLLLHTYLGGERRTIYTTSDHYIITERDSTSLRARSEALRMRLLRRLQRGPLPAGEAAIAAAMTLGWRADLDAETQSAFRDAGIAHLLAVSGLHIGLVAAMLGVLCFWLPRERKGRTARGVVQLAGVWSFALLTGMAPSTMRAALMFSLFIISNIIGRRTPKLNLLAATAIVTLAVRPMLLFDVGWQLSYAAVAGILLARPVIMLWRNWLWQAAAVSASATLATLPVSLAVFNRLQPYFLIANVIIVPLAGVILALSMAYLAVPCGFTAWLLHWPLAGANILTRWVSSLPGAVVEVETYNGMVTIVLAIVVTAMLLALKPLIGQRSSGMTTM